MTKFNLMIAAALVSVAALPVQAGPAKSIAVETGDLNLASVEGIAALNSRIAVAVKAACSDSDVRNLSDTQDLRRCRLESMGKAQKWAEGLIARRSALASAN
ncbi:UrcA family protein [Sandaracinobacteroides saxicola]|uniref:UrcA family protein n=1 Tax=Sandaracinobacteroides saxicola TaxID=2759707 RepID=A0A7G5IF52_9SPHN|nr:UrcA family protein [Sandaracinobacteroides saxicola]QMW21994.1 UrcA family protein [Sandaracinobacteroides saxicola]